MIQMETLFIRSDLWNYSNGKTMKLEVIRGNKKFKTAFGNEVNWKLRYFTLCFFFQLVQYRSEEETLLKQFTLKCTETWREHVDKVAKLNLMGVEINPIRFTGKFWQF